MSRLLAPLLVLSFLALSASAAPKRSNVLILVADDVGVDLLDVYGLGADLPETPNIDKLRAEGVMFRNAWSNPVCSATRATLLTGRYGFRTGVGYVVDSTFALRPKELTLPEVLDAQATGYTHAAFGKWHLGNDSTGGIGSPNVAGFSHFAGTLGNLVPPNASYFNWPQIVDGVSTPATGYVTTRTTQDALAWIQSAPEPWLCYVAFNAVHEPFHTPPAELYKVDLSGVGDPSVEPRPHFKAMVEAMDHEIGNLLEGMGTILDDTTVIFVGDNGTPTDVTVAPFLPSHAKATVFQGGIQVPLIISGPDVKERGSECSALVSTVDVFATAVELAGALNAFPPAPSGSEPGPVAQPDGGSGEFQPIPAAANDGVSLVPYLRKPGTPSIRQFVFSELFRPNGFGTPVDVRRAIRERRYKYMFNEPANPTPEGPGAQADGGMERLYDLWTDPFELTNLLEKASLTTEEQKAYDRLKQRLNELLGS